MTTEQTTAGKTTEQTTARASREFEAPTDYRKLCEGERYREVADPRGQTFRKGLPYGEGEERPVLRAGEFDHAAAWEDFARPAFLALDPLSREVFGLVAAAAREEKQDRECLLSGLDKVRHHFDRLRTRELARLSLVSSVVEHWAPARGALDLGNFGAGWRVSNLADQELRRRLGLEPVNYRKAGTSLTVSAGRLRVHVSTLDSSWSVDLGLAVPEMVPGSLARSERDWRAMAADHVEAEPSEVLRGLLNPGSAFAPKGYRRHDCRECGRSPLFGRATADHEMTCSAFPVTGRADALLRHAEVYGLTAEDCARVRAALGCPADPPAGRATPPTAAERLPGEAL